MHYQGVDKLGAGLTVEATAPDGVIEAVSAEVNGAPVLAVQWHPEWKANENPQSQMFLNCSAARCAGVADSRATRTNEGTSHAAAITTFPSCAVSMSRTICRRKPITAKSHALGGSRIITRAEGSTIYDGDGNAILDGMAGLVVRECRLWAR